jgi:hypothetical protein
MEDIKNIRNSILTSVGMLPGYVTGEQESMASLKAYVRYLRKIDSIQKCIIQGLKHLALVELVSRGFINVSHSDIKVVFANNISLANIERLEFLDILVSLVKNYSNYIDELSKDKSLESYIDKIQMLEFIKKKLSYMKGAEAPIRVNVDSTRDELTEDTSEIDEILRRLPKEVIAEAYNNIEKIESEVT